MRLDKWKASKLSLDGAWFDAEAQDYKPMRKPHETQGCVLVSAFDTPAYRDARHQAIASGAKDWQSTALANGCLHDWRNFDEAVYSRDEAAKVLADPEFFRLCRFVENCAHVMTNMGREALEEAAGN